MNSDKEMTGPQNQTQNKNSYTTIFETVFPFRKTSLKIQKEKDEPQTLLNDYFSGFGTSSMEVHSDNLIVNTPWGGLLIYNLKQNKVLLQTTLRGFIQAYMVENDTMYALCEKFNVESKKLPNPYCLTTINLASCKITDHDISTNLKVAERSKLLKMSDSTFWLVEGDYIFGSTVWVLNFSIQNNVSKCDCKCIKLNDVLDEIGIEYDNTVYHSLLKGNELMVVTKHAILTMTKQLDTIRYYLLSKDVFNRFSYNGDLYLMKRKDGVKLFKITLSEARGTCSKKRKATDACDADEDDSSVSTKKSKTGNDTTKRLRSQNKTNSKKKQFRTDASKFKCEEVMKLDVDKLNCFSVVSDSSHFAVISDKTLHVYDVLTKQKLFAKDLDMTLGENLKVELFSPMKDHLCIINSVFNVLGGNFQRTFLVDIGAHKIEEIKVKELARSVQFYKNN